MASISLTSKQIKVFSNAFLSEIFENIDADYQMLMSSGKYEHSCNPKLALFQYCHRYSPYKKDLKPFFKELIIYYFFSLNTSLLFADISLLSYHPSVGKFFILKLNFISNPGPQVAIVATIFPLLPNPE